MRVIKTLVALNQHKIISAPNKGTAHLIEACSANTASVCLAEPEKSPTDHSFIYSLTHLAHRKKLQLTSNAQIGTAHALAKLVSEELGPHKWRANSLGA